ncbi:MAG: GH32 C-terminal domain-containing protein [Atopobiaceae bacterium]
MATALERDLDRLRQEKEQGAAHGSWAELFHLMPPVGWLNDPNGLAQYQGRYFAYFQYSPFDVNGGVKCWGFQTSQDLLQWHYEGCALYPDQPADVSGVYSGSALVQPDGLHIFYTGNVKLEDQDGYDYIHSGREANTVHTVTKDGLHFGPKHVVMRNTDYPEDDTCHVRDPKVWQDGKDFWMVQGARRSDDVGEILLFHSDDLDHWTLAERLTTPEPFGFMWECPDCFDLDDKAGVTHHILSTSPQGLSDGAWARRNVYQSGFFELSSPIQENPSFGDFALWDAGFDFYAPQTFAADDGRRILIGWMGMPDTPEVTNLTIADGWQHCFTLPREISFEDGQVVQRPVRELLAHRTDEQSSEGSFVDMGTPAFDCEIENGNLPFTATIAHELRLSWDGQTFRMAFEDPSKDSVGAGRTERWEELPELSSLRIIVDASSVEVFLEGVPFTFSTRFYPKQHSFIVDAAPEVKTTFWSLSF